MCFKMAYGDLFFRIPDADRNLYERNEPLFFKTVTLNESRYILPIQIYENGLFISMYTVKIK